METENNSELSRPYVDMEAGDVAPRTHLGEPRRDEHESTNRIRERGGDVKVVEEGPSRAAPTQGTDCSQGQPS